MPPPVRQQATSNLRLPTADSDLARHHSHRRFQYRRSRGHRAHDAGHRPLAVRASRHAAIDVPPSRLVGRSDHGLGHARRVGQGADVPLHRRAADARHAGESSPGTCRNISARFAAAASGGGSAWDSRSPERSPPAGPWPVGHGPQSGHGPRPAVHRRHEHGGGAGRRRCASERRSGPSRSTCSARRSPAKSKPSATCRPISI